MPQDYPRTEEGLLDESRLAAHTGKIPFDELKAIIRDAIVSAARKSRREILELPDGLSEEEKTKIYGKKGKRAVRLFPPLLRRPGGDGLRLPRQALPRDRAGAVPQSDAPEAADEFRLALSVHRQGLRGALAALRDGVRHRRLGSRLQRDDEHRRTWPRRSTSTCRSRTARTRWAARIGRRRSRRSKTSRVPTRTAPARIICVFGIAIDKGQRQIRRIGKTKAPYSVNTEVWLSDFFWPFFANYTYAEIAKAVFEVLMETGRQGQQPLATLIPDELIDSFGDGMPRRAACSTRRGGSMMRSRLIDVFCNNTRHEQGVSDNQ